VQCRCPRESRQVLSLMRRQVIWYCIVHSDARPFNPNQRWAFGSHVLASLRDDAAMLPQTFSVRPPRNRPGKSCATSLMAGATVWCRRTEFHAPDVRNPLDWQLCLVDTPFGKRWSQNRATQQGRLNSREAVLRSVTKPLADRPGHMGLAVTATDLSCAETPGRQLITYSAKL
jgi:hypothetical protein